jgi:hypothetical protein
MDNQLAHKLFVLTTPEVQEALGLLLEDRKQDSLWKSSQADNEMDVFRLQGRAIEADYLLNIRQKILDKVNR